MSYQKIIIVGNLGRDPELRYTPTGQGVTNFSVATNRAYTNSSGEKIKEVCWFRVSAWGKQAENCNKYLFSGSQVLVEGRLDPDKETGNPKTYKKQDGSVGVNYDLVADRVVFLTKSPKGADKEIDLSDDEIPF